MPYRSYRRPRRWRGRYAWSGYGRGRYKKKGLGALSSRVRKLEMQQDFKSVDTIPSSYFITNTGVVKYISGIAQGDEHNNRDGDKVTYRSLMIRGVITNSFTTTPKDAIVRIIVVKLQDTNGADPTVSGTASTSILSAASVNSMYELHNSHHFRVLFDKVFPMDDGDHMQRAFSFYTKLRTVGKYSGTTSSVTSQQHNGIFVLALCDQASGDNQPKMYFTSRLRYID